MPLSAASAEFVRNHLASLIQLDIALLLQSDPEVWWSADRVANQLRVASNTARESLEKLAARNLLDVRIASDLTYRFAPWHQSEADIMSDIAANHYEAREIAARARGGSPAERFADAFRIRKSDG
jgi:hypothetical protein